MTEKKVTKKAEKKPIKKSGNISEMLDQMVSEGSKMQKPADTKSKAAPAKPAVSKAKVDPNKPKENEKFDRSWKIYYAGMEDKLPKNAPTDGLTLESIRQHLQKLYPEMSAERTTFQLDRDKKYIFPIISGGKKG